MAKLWTPEPKVDVAAQNEQIRKAVVEFLMHRGWMRMEIEGKGPYIRTAGQLIDDLAKAVEKAIGHELEEYT